jgi:cytochrome c peroxidase
VTLRIVAWCATAVIGLTAVVRAAEGWPPLGLDLYRPVPATNDLTPAKVALGRQLFFDLRLSADGTRSCASCHEPGRAFAGRFDVGVGVGNARGRRNAPALINRAWGATFFWDGRAATLEQQVLEPILNSLELGLTEDEVLALARSSSYETGFKTAFGVDATMGDVARALASYLRTIVAGDAPYDRYRAGDRSALGPEAARGLGVFAGKAGCTRCHAGPLLTDELFHNTGVAWRDGRLTDIGRAAVTGEAADRGAFKTPTLREVARTAPYMHDGSVATLDDVIDFYDRGGEPNPGLDSRMRPLGLTVVEKGELRAFLAALTGTVSEGR